MPKEKKLHAWVHETDRDDEDWVQYRCKGCGLTFKGNVLKVGQLLLEADQHGCLLPHVWRVKDRGARKTTWKCPACRREVKSQAGMEPLPGGCLNDPEVEVIFQREQ